MKKQYNIIGNLILAFLTLFLIIGISSCEEEDFRIIPDPVEAQTITSIAPDLASIGTRIVITGTNFSPVAANNIVRFGDVLAEVSSATETALTVIVPQGATTGPITVSKAKFDVQGPVFTIVAAPVITALSATGAAVGETLIITGENFGATAAGNIVAFNGVEAEIMQASETEITVTIPADATTGSLTVEVLGQLATNPFTIAPVITSFAPLRGTGNDEITITGTNFDPAIDNNNVSFNGVAATVVSASSTALVVVVPPEANAGKIAVEIEQLLALSEADFTSVPTVASFLPEIAAPNAEVTITGTNFSSIPDENIVSFNGLVATIIASSKTSIIAIVPEGSETGFVTVEVNGETGTSSTEFMVDNSRVTINLAINEVNDDVEEAADGRMSLRSADLELGEFDTFGTPDLGLQKIGLRFNAINIPVGATIESASIVFIADQDPGANPTEMTISGENVGNAAPYLEVVNNLSDRPLTMANAVWNIPEWTGTDTPLENRTTVDISSIISEIIARSDWQDGNSMNFIFEATGVSAGATANNVGREAETYDVNNPQEGALLNITYRFNN